MNPFKKLKEVNRKILIASRNRATKEVALLKKEKEKWLKLIESNPGLCIIG